MEIWYTDILTTTVQNSNNSKEYTLHSVVTI